MSRSHPRDLCWAFKTLWEAHPKNKGRLYGITGRDMRAAKELVDANDWQELLVELEPRFARFMASDFSGWKDANYPAWGLFTQWNRYMGPVSTSTRQWLWCAKCMANHWTDEQCKVKV